MVASALIFVIVASRTPLVIQRTETCAVARCGCTTKGLADPPSLFRGLKLSSLCMVASAICPTRGPLLVIQRTETETPSQFAPSHQTLADPSSLFRGLKRSNVSLPTNSNMILLADPSSLFRGLKRVFSASMRECDDRTRGPLLVIQRTETES